MSQARGITSRCQHARSCVHVDTGRSRRPVRERSEFSPKLELVINALDAAYEHMYGPDTRHHIRNAFRADATIDEIMEVLKLGVVQGARARNLGIAILAEELEHNAPSQN